MKWILTLWAALIGVAAMGQSTVRRAPNLATLQSQPPSGVNPTVFVEGLNGGFFTWNASSVVATNALDAIAYPYGSATGRYLRQVAMGGVLDFDSTSDLTFLDLKDFSLDGQTVFLQGVQRLDLVSADLYLSANTNLSILTPQMSTWDPSSVLLTNRLLTLVDPTNGYWEAVSLGELQGGSRINTAVLPLGGATNYWAFGDSQTFGQMGVALVTNWLSGGRILETYRYPNRLASQFGLTVSNLAVSSSGMRYNTNTANTRKTPFNQLGRYVPVGWSGLVTVMQGYNDALLDLAESKFYPVWRNGIRAFAARALLDGYVASGGVTHEGAAYSSWSTDGSVYTDASAEDENPFPIGNPGTDPRVLTELVGSQSITITTTNRSNVAVFYETSDTAGDAWVYTNGSPVMSFSANVVGSTNRVAGVVMLRNLPDGIVDIAITNMTGTNRIFAVGWLVDPNAADKTVILGTPLVLGSSIRDDVSLLSMGESVVSAASEFSQWNVAVANCAEAIDLTTDMLPSDANHPTPQGQWKIAQAFAGAKRVSRSETVGSPWWKIDRRQTVSRYGQFTGAVSGGYERVPALNLAYTGGFGYILSYDYGTGTYYPTYYDSDGHIFRQGAGLFTSSGGVISGVSGAALAYSGGQSYLDATDGAGGFEALNLRGSPVIASSGGFHATSSGGAAGVPSVTLAYSAGIGYVQSTGADGLTFTPLYLRGAGVNIENGALQISSSGGTFKSVDSVLVYSTGGSGYVNTYNGASLATIPLELNGAPVSVAGAGGFRVGAGSGSRGMSVNSGQNSLSFVDLNTGIGTNRWRIQKTSTAESGANVGADFAISRYADNGSSLGTPLSISRSTGIVSMVAADVTASLQSAIIELGDASDTTLARSAAGTVTVEGDTVLTAPASATLTTSGGAVTISGGGRKVRGLSWAADGDANLVFTNTVDGDTGTLLVWAASTNVTLTLTDAFAYSPSGSTLTVTGGTNNWSVVAWEARTINATNVVLVNLGDYSR